MLFLGKHNDLIPRMARLLEMSYLLASSPNDMQSAPQGQICSDNCMCCHTDSEVSDQRYYLSLSQNTDMGTTRPL